MALVEWYLKPYGHNGFNDLNYINVSIDPTVVYGSRSILGASLFIPYVVSVSEKSGLVKLLSLEGGISWGFSVTIEEARLLIPSQVVWENPQCKLHVPITDKQIEAIENARNGSTINLSVQLAGMALGNASLGAVVPVQGSSLQSLSIGREQWITILKQLQYSSRRLVELPEPNIPRNILDWNECIRLLDNATLFYQRGEYEQVVTSCRSIAEGIPQVLCKMWGLPQKKQGDQSQEKWLREMKGRLENAWQDDTLTPTMLETLLVGAWKWLAPTPHYGVGIPAKEESAFALELCTSLLHFAGQVLQAHPHPIPRKESKTKEEEV